MTIHEELNKILKEQKYRDDHCILSSINNNDRVLICYKYNYLCKACPYHTKLKIKHIEIDYEKE